MNRAIKLRQQINFNLREFLSKNNYTEVDVPTLSPKLIPESHLEVFTTKLNSPNMNAPETFFLLASPEAYLKRLLAQEAANYYYLGKSYRNHEPLAHLHNHEFTILEWYKINYTYKDLMKEIEQMIRYVANKLDNKIGINFTSPWEYLTLDNAYSMFAAGTKITAENFEQTYVQFIEPHLGTRGKPTFIYDFPTWQSPLAKSNGTVAERFELYINGVELINGWTELTDPKIQKQNLVRENKERIRTGKEPLPLDIGFIKAIQAGMPKCSGAAMGVDRLIMVLGGFKSLAQVILFPTAKLVKSV